MPAENGIHTRPIQDGKDGNYQTRQIVCSDKVVLTPNYCVSLTKSPFFDDLNLLLQIQGETKGHLKSYSLRIFDYDRVLRERINRIRQTDLVGGTLEPSFKSFFESFLFILDQSSESFEYARYLSKLSMCTRIPKRARDFAQELLKFLESKKSKLSDRSARVLSFWENLSKEELLPKFLGESFDLSSQTLANIILPFTIVVDSPRSFKIAQEVNKYWKAILKSYSQPTVAYLLLKKSALRNDWLVDEIVRYIEELEVDVLVIKIKNLKLTEPNDMLPRESYRRILESVSTFRALHDQSITIALECGDLLFANGIKSFDIVNRSMSGSDEEKESSGGAQPVPWGSALDLDDLVAVPFEVIEKEYKESGLPICSHKYCMAHMKPLDREQYPSMDWNIDRRPHNALIMDEWMNQIATAIINGDSSLISQKIHNSKLRILGDMFPNRR